MDLNALIPRIHPQGYTTTPELSALFDEVTPPTIYGHPNVPASIGGLSYWCGLDGPRAMRALELLPESCKENAQNEAPTFHQFARLASLHPEVRLHGYRVPPARSDERIAVEGCLLYLETEDTAEAQRTLEEWLNEVGYTGHLEEFGPLGNPNLLYPIPEEPGKFIYRAWWD